MNAREQPYITSARLARVRSGVRISSGPPADVPATIIACEFSVERLRGWIARGEKNVSELVQMNDVEYIELPTGHWPQFTKPDELTHAIVAAIDRG